MAKLSASYVDTKSRIPDSEELMSVYSNGEKFEVAWKLWIIEKAKTNKRIAAHLFEVVSCIRHSLEVELNISEQEATQDGESKEGSTVN